MPSSTAPKLSTRELLDLLAAVNKQIPKADKGSEYAELLKERQRLTNELERAQNERAKAKADAQLKQKLLEEQKRLRQAEARAQQQREAKDRRRNERLDRNAERNRGQATNNGPFRAGERNQVKASRGKPLGTGDVRAEQQRRNRDGVAPQVSPEDVRRTREELQRQQGRGKLPRGAVDPVTAKKPPGQPDVGGRKPQSGKPSAPIPTGNKRPINLGVSLPIPGSVDSRQYDDATSKAIDFATSGYDLLPKEITDNPVLRPYLRSQTRISRDVLNSLARATPIAGVINVLAEEFGIYKGKSPGAAAPSNVSNEAIGATLQQIAGYLQNNLAGIESLIKMQQAQGVALQAIGQASAAAATQTTAVPTVLALAMGIQSKVGAANFSLQNQAASLTLKKLPILDATKIMATVRLAQPKLENLNAAQVTKAADLAVQKLRIIDATQLMQTSRLAERKWNILDATQLMQTSRLAERKWKILDATQLMQTSRLAERKWNILDATQLMRTSRLAEQKWGVLNATQLMGMVSAATPRHTQILSAIGKINLAPVQSQLTQLSTRISQIRPTVIPSDLARKSDVQITVNPRISPTPVTVTPTPITVNPTPVTVNPTPVDLSSVNNQIAAMGQNLTRVINSQTTNITNVINNAPKTDLSPVLNPLADIGTVLGVPQLKPGLSVRPDAQFVELGNQSNNGSSPLTANSLPQLMMSLAAVPYVRQGLHRLGGQFDTSVMNPAKGKTQITDALGFQEWTFNQIDERLGMPTPHTIKQPDGRTETKTFSSLEDALEENNANTIAAIQDLEIVERYLFALTQDLQKLMQIALQTREDVDVLIDDAGCKTKETKKTHPTHINLKAPTGRTSLSELFKRGEVHYVARQWADSADKNQKLERVGYDTQIAAMSNKFDFDKTNPELPLDKSRATRPQTSDETWKTFVSTMTEPPEGYTAPGNPIPEIKEIKNGTPKPVPKPTNPNSKLGK